jgi:hypothetical protein
MSAFISGVIFGFLLAGSIAVAIVTHRKRPKHREIEPWKEESYNQERLSKPQVTTKVSIHERTIQL